MTRHAASSSAVIQPELPLFKLDEPQLAEELELTVAERIRLGIEAGLAAGKADTRRILDADLEMAILYLKLQGSARYDAGDWVQKAKAIVDPNLATLTLFERAVNFTIACGESEGGPDYRIEASVLLLNLRDEIAHHRAQG